MLRESEVGMRLRFGSFATALLLAMVGVACGSSSEQDEKEAAPPADPKWSETTSTLGVTSWALVPDENGEDRATLTGYDDAHAVRAQFIVDGTRDAQGNVAARIRSVVQGPAVLEFRALPDRSIGVLQNTFRDHPDAERALSLAVATMKMPDKAKDGPLTTSSRGLQLLDNQPLVGNQEQLICTDARGNACQKPPEVGGLFGVAGSCITGVLGLAGSACLLTGAETIGIGCLVSAGGAIYGALACADGVAQNANCSCVTVCADQCRRQYDRYYWCAPNSASCAATVQEDRRQEAACVSACGS